MVYTDNYCASLANNNIIIIIDCDRVMVMSSGKLLEVGPSKEMPADANSQLSALACHERHISNMLVTGCTFRYLRFLKYFKRVEDF